VWQRRQTSSQQATTGPAPMERVERTNVVMVREQRQKIVAPRRNPRAMEVDRGRNCYTYGGFGHMACHCRNQERERVADERKLEYGEWNIEENHEHLNHLKEKENLESLN